MNQNQNQNQIQIQNQIFHRQNLKIPLLTTTFLAPKKAAELILKALQMQSVGFEYCILDKPINGTILIHHNQKNQIDDGYGWLDNEDIFKFTLDDGVEIEIISRNYGFNHGDTYAQVKRKRYRLIQNRELELVQYLRNSSDQSQVVQMHLVKIRPSSLGNVQNFSQNNGQNNSQNNSQNFNQNINQNKKLKFNAPIKVVEEERDPEGDELDKSFPRAVSLERYKRNHLYFEQLLNPTKISQLTPASTGVDDNYKERLEAVKESQAELDDEILRLSKRSVSDVYEYRQRSKQDWDEINDLKDRTKALIEMYRGKEIHATALNIE